MAKGGLQVHVLRKTRPAEKALQKKHRHFASRTSRVKYNIACAGPVFGTTLWGARILADTTLRFERWKLTVAPTGYVSIPSTFMAEIAKN